MERARKGKKMTTTDDWNAMTSAAEVQAALVEGLPHFLYVFPDRREVSTWTGQKLGSYRSGTAWTSNMGDNRRTLHVRGIDGREYTYTAYESAGDYARR